MLKHIMKFKINVYRNKEKNANYRERMPDTIWKV